MRHRSKKTTCPEKTFLLLMNLYGACDASANICKKAETLGACSLSISHFDGILRTMLRLLFKNLRMAFNAASVE